MVSRLETETETTKVSVSRPKSRSALERMLHDNVSSTGELNKAKFSRALLRLRNTPDRDTKKSPAMALYGRELRDFLPRPGSALMGDLWIKLADARETTLARRCRALKDFWSVHTRALVPLRWGIMSLCRTRLVTI